MPVRSVTQDIGRTISAPRPTERRNPSSSRITVLSGAAAGGSGEVPHRSSAAPGGAARPFGTKTILFPGKHCRTIGRFQRGNPQAWSTAGRSLKRSGLATVSVMPTDVLDQVFHHRKMTLPARGLVTAQALNLRSAPRTVRPGIVEHRRLPARTIERVEVVRDFIGDSRNTGRSLAITGTPAVSASGSGMP